jgi:flagellar biosynthesis GTPase FlhF
MECFCCFLIIIISVIAVTFYSKEAKKAKESRSHGESDETDGTGWRTAGSSQDSEDQRRRQAEHRAQRMAKQRREHSPEPPTLAEIKAKLEEEKQRLTKLKRVQEDQAWVMQEELELERSEIEEPEVESAPDEDLVSTEQVIEPPESDPGVRLVEAVPLLEALPPMPPEVQDEVVEEQVGDVDDEAVEQSSPEEKPTDDASVTVELFCETCMGEEVVSYDSEQIFKDQFEGQPVAWNGLLKSIDRLSYDRHFKAENGFLATLEIFEIKGRYDTRPVLAVVLLTPEQKAAWEPSLNQEMAFRGTLFALDAFGRKVYLNLRD